MQCELINTANLVGNFAGSEAREGEAMIALSAQRDCFKHAFAEINADNRISTSGHGARVACSGNRADELVSRM